MIVCAALLAASCSKDEPSAAEQARMDQADIEAVNAAQVPPPAPVEPDRITITDIEAVTEPTDLVEGVSGALGRITTRLLLVGMLLMVALVAGHDPRRILSAML